MPWKMQRPLGRTPSNSRRDQSHRPPQHSRRAVSFGREGPELLSLQVLRPRALLVSRRNVVSSVISLVDDVMVKLTAQGCPQRLGRPLSFLDSRNDFAQPAKLFIPHHFQMASLWISSLARWVLTFEPIEGSKM